MPGIFYDLIRSWSDEKGSVNGMDVIREWIRDRNTNLKVRIDKIDFSYDGFWYYDTDTGRIRNRNGSFFQLSGLRVTDNGVTVAEQPVILQMEVGYLGILCQKINGTLNFLMQAKIEPGNVNVIQISPTIQATKSNFTRKHGGKAPAYLEYFVDSAKRTILVDQLQSEQSSRFLHKRNRNIILLLDEDEKVDVLPSHKWMTLGQIKALMHEDNLVNMDTRTVLSCIPYSESTLTEEERREIAALFRDKALYASMFGAPDHALIHRVFNRINDHKMYSDAVADLIPLRDLKTWDITEKDIVCRDPHDFKVIYCDIEIEGREVRRWEQPLVEALGMYVLGVYTRVHRGVRQFLVRALEEIGCFDTVELGPTVQLEPTNPRNHLNVFEESFLDRMATGEGVLRDVVLSEEGGRFYHEQNRNVIIQVADDALPEIPDDWFWMDYATVNHMIQFNNVVNIQLRNLLSLLDL